MAKHMPHKANFRHATFVLKPAGNSLLCNTTHHGTLELELAWEAACVRIRVRVRVSVKLRVRVSARVKVRVRASVGRSMW